MTPLCEIIAPQLWNMNQLWLQFLSSLTAYFPLFTEPCNSTLHPAESTRKPSSLLNGSNPAVWNQNLTLTANPLASVLVMPQGKIQEYELEKEKQLLQPDYPTIPPPMYQAPQFTRMQRQNNISYQPVPAASYNFAMGPGFLHQGTPTLLRSINAADATPREPQSSQNVAQVSPVASNHGISYPNTYTTNGFPAWSHHQSNFASDNFHTVRPNIFCAPTGQSIDMRDRILPQATVEMPTTKTNSVSISNRNANSGIDFQTLHELTRRLCQVIKTLMQLIDVDTPLDELIDVCQAMKAILKAIYHIWRVHKIFS
uniref:PABC domain-containing protein n=1 Tax=Mesocestoides corti TaxID=53468 RepID=A0A5K3EZ43_MESCO